MYRLCGVEGQSHLDLFVCVVSLHPRNSWYHMVRIRLQIFSQHDDVWSGLVIAFVDIGIWIDRIHSILMKSSACHLLSG